MRETIKEHFDKLLAFAALFVAVGVLFGIICLKATDFNKLGEYVVTGGFTSLTTLLTGKAIAAYMKKDTDGPSKPE